MQIVIKIPDHYYENNIKKELPIILSEDNIIAILPKGHGKLFDAREYENSIRKHYFDNATVIRCTEIALGNAPTIVEADEEE